MAISGDDGSIILTTKVDTGGLNKGLASMRNAANSTASTFKKLGGYVATALSVTAFINFSREAGQMASTTEASVQRLIDIYGKASQAVDDFIHTSARSLGLSESAAVSVASTYGNLLSVWADQETNAKLTNALLNQTSVVASKTGRTFEDVAERIRSGLLGNTEAIEDLGINVNIKTIEITDAFKRIANGRSWEQLNAYEQAQVRTLAILEQSTKKYGTEVASTTAFARQQYQAAYEDFKNTWGQVVNIILIPILRVLTRIFNTLTAGLKSVANLSKSTLEVKDNFADQENSIQGTVGAQKELTDEIKETVKEQNKLLAGFDEAYVLAQKASGIGGTGGFDEGIFGDFDITDTIVNEQEYTSALSAIGMVVGTALVGLGIIMLFSGHPLIGIAMIASGYVLTEGSIEGSQNLGDEEKKKLAIIGEVTGLALMGLGVLLLFTKAFWAFGLGMIAAGASAVYLSLSLGNFSEDIQTKLLEILLITASVLLVLGVLLLFTKTFWKYGLFMLASAASEIYIAATTDGLAVKKIIVDFVNENYGDIVKWAAALLVIGIILLFTGAGIGVGLTLIATAAGMIWGATEINTSDSSNLIADAVESMYNSAIGAAESGNEKLSAVLGKSLIGGVNTGSFGRSLVDYAKDYAKVNGYASGTVVPPNRPHYALFGDNTREPEIVSPVSTMKQAFSDVLAETGGGSPIALNVYLDGDVVYSTVVERNKLNTIMTGQNALA